jgi:hypothetical protein
MRYLSLKDLSAEEFRHFEMNLMSPKTRLCQSSQ